MKKNMNRLIYGMMTAVAFTLCACSSTTAESSTETASTPVSTTATEEITTVSSTSNGKLDTSSIFTERDLTQTVDTSNAVTYTLSDNQDITITEEGVYVITGSASNVTITVEAEDTAKVQIVLDGVTITNDNAPAIYVISADKVFVTTTESENTLSVTGTFTAIGDTNTDAVIFSKEDLTLNGKGTLTISSTCNGITSKDDLKITGGTYNISSTEDSLEANDSIAIAGGTFNINSSKDGLHCEYDEDDTVGYIYIADGTFNITAADDGMQATTIMQIDGGTFTINASEGIEGTYVQINGGTISINASDDGINAAQKSTAVDVCIEFTGGDTTIVMGSGDTDGVDSNGSILVSGGTINVTGNSTFDYDTTASMTGGTVICNGTQVTSIPQSMMGGGQGMMGGKGGH